MTPLNAEPLAAGEALRQSEAHFRSLFEINLDGILLTVPAGGILAANPAICAMLGRTEEEICELGRAGVIDDTDPRFLRAKDERARQGKVFCELTGVRKDGTRFPVELMSVVLPGGTKSFVIIRDITERKRMEEELRQHAADLAEADRHKDEFLAMLAHELRNPLAPIRNSIQVMRATGNGNPDLERQQDIIDRQVTHMARLLDDLLDVSRITRGKITLSLQPLRLADILTQSVEIATPLIDSHRHQLIVSMPPPSLCVLGDVDRLVQVVSNLLNNAAKYSEESGKIWLEAFEEEGSAVVRVRDTGIGIAPEMLLRVFDIFAQANHTLNRAEGGLGIGLTMARNLVQMHGGTIEACSAGQGYGSEFIVRLPALAAATMAETPPAPARPAPGVPAVPRRILIVDDVADTANSLAELLALWGHTARAVYDGPTALQVARAFEPEVILLDIGLPGMNGYELARHLRASQGRGLRLVALTGFGQDSDRRQALEAGFDDYLVKPVDLAALGALLQ